jgi:ABC-type uncharacterized transport system permease subunit
MKTYLIFSTILLFVYLAISSMLLGNTLFDWLVDTGITANIFRLLLSVLLYLLLIYHMPRKKLFRYILAVGAAASFCTGTYYLLNSRINVIDALLYIEAGIILALEAIEVKKIQLSKHTTPIYQVPVKVY